MGKKVGLCLSGGGARGAYQIGAVQALKELGIYEEVEVMSGTSIGAANASLLACNPVEKVKDIWFHMPEETLVVRKPMRDKSLKEIFTTLRDGIFKLDSLQNLMFNHIKIKEIKEKEVYITVSESGAENHGLLQLIDAGYKHYIKKIPKSHYISLHKATQDECIKAVTTSCSIPGVFPPVIHEGKQYYDGGVFDNKPVTPLVNAGCTDIYVIEITFFIQPVNYEKKYPNVNFHIIKPSKSIGNVLDFTEEHAKRIYDMGYKDTYKYFEQENTEFIQMKRQTV